MNSINLVGRLTYDPELRKTQNGTSVCQFDLAVDRPHTKDTTDFFKIVVWRQGAEYLCQYGRRGNVVAVSGVLTTRKYEDKNGNKRTAYEVVADSIQLYSGKNDGAARTSFNVLQQQAFEEVPDGDEDLPF